ncbi:hypothetical protein C7B69_19480, partial [filamentous cyanobacterium Phorm 46]
AGVGVVTAGVGVGVMEGVGVEVIEGVGVGAGVGAVGKGSGLTVLTPLESAIAILFVPSKTAKYSFVSLS